MITAPAAVSVPSPDFLPAHAGAAAAPPFPTLALALATVPEHRGSQGLLHPLPAMLLAVVYAMLCDKKHPAAIAEWVDTHYDTWLRETAGFTQPRRPCRTTFHLFLRGLAWAALERALLGWIAAVATVGGLDLAQEALALDGKECRGVRRMCGEALVTISAFTHQSGLTLALRTCAEGQELGAVQALLQQLTLSGRVITADALHTQRETAQLIVDRGGDYVLTVKGNQPALAAAVQACLTPAAAPGQDRVLCRLVGHGHGRQEERTLVAVSLRPGEIDWPGAAQVFCLTRTVQRRKQKDPTFEVVYGITSLDRSQADAARLLQLNRGHWGIENRSHWVRDVVFREDASLSFLDHTAEALAVVRTAVISLLRLHQVRNLASQLRINGDQAKNAARFLGLPMPV
jgi:predicted transposase YbfD/YdcC